MRLMSLLPLLSPPAAVAAYDTPPPAMPNCIPQDVSLPREEWRLDTGGLALHLPQVGW